MMHGPINIREFLLTEFLERQKMVALHHGCFWIFLKNVATALSNGKKYVYWIYVFLFIFPFPLFTAIHRMTFETATFATVLVMCVFMLTLTAETGISRSVFT